MMPGATEGLEGRCDQTTYSADPPAMVEMEEGEGEEEGEVGGGGGDAGVGVGGASAWLGESGGSIESCLGRGDNCQAE